MSRDKQIEERNELVDLLEDIGNDWDAYIDECLENEERPQLSYEDFHADEILDAGYRKASDVAEKIFAEIDKIIDKHYNNHIFGNNDLDDLEHEAIINFSDDVTYDIAELKKKYTEGGE